MIVYIVVTCTHLYIYYYYNNHSFSLFLLLYSFNIGLLARQSRFRHYVKPWMKRKRAKEVKKYKAMEKIVSNLKRYVQFTNDFNKSSGV